MPVPSSLSSVSITAGSNSPGGSEDRTTADDYLRAYAALLKQGVTQGADIAAGASLVIPSDGLLHHITGGSTAITGAIGGYVGRLVILTTANRQTLTHSGAIVCPGGVSTYLDAGDVAICTMGESSVLTVRAITRRSALAFKSTMLTMPYTDTSLVVTHNLGYSPSPAEINITMVLLSANALYNQLYVHAVTSTTIDIRRVATASGAEIRFYVGVTAP
ncbi:hypothetical protein [Thiothrix fructosivorans]|uniref:Uncharacterized protein n=1 Tax=Thiothrix fructosivorans TaxID=111770 RepID=A0A8B0SI89_9GAMM|nr:hypothetical protein [Thiothrix fructosivorans]MBO0611705.1 hypothetical protein [Thiothrix fructosivorans]QTX10635.1 hypothetical protein J1836_019055 [Thiothrix fructosivorans]